MRRLAVPALTAAFATSALAMPPPLPDVANASMAELQVRVEAGEASYESLASAYIVRSRELDPKLRAIIAVNPNALTDARAADLGFRADAAAADGRRGTPLFGMPILIKDNIETLDPMATTAGSLALAGNVTGR
ncbi:MAG TPA: amidase family protein, partial [Caulobacter sp.]|nr:amidase family protein [Caulobacter sp.]